MLFTYPDPMTRRYSEEGIPEWVAEEWAALGSRLSARQMTFVDGRPASHVVGFEPSAHREWVDWCNAHFAEVQADDFPDSLDGAWGKLDAYAAQLTLILHLVNLATDFDRPSTDVPAVPRRVVRDAARLISYFKSHARRVHAAIGGGADDGGEDVRALLRWIVRNEHATFSERDVRRNFDRFNDDPEALPLALAWMAQRNLVRPITPAVASPKGGRKPSPAFDINPSVLTSPRFRRFRRNGG